MIRRFLILYFALVFYFVVAGCGNDGNRSGSPEDEYPAASEQFGEGDSEVDGSVFNGDDTENGQWVAGDWNNRENSEGGFEVCQTVTTGLEEVPSRMMILLDKSQSMDDDGKWGLAMEAIDSMVGEFDKKIAFGLDIFNVVNSSGRNRFDRDSGMCEVGESVVLDVAPENGVEIQETLAGYHPSSATPLLLSMMNYKDATYSPLFLDQTGSSYLVIISDGMDTCGTTAVFSPEGGASAQQLAQVTEEIRDTLGVKTIVIGFGEGADQEQLNAIAQAGGTEFNQYFDANDGDELTAALSTIAQAVVVSCQFQIGQLDESEVNLDLVNVFFDGEPVPRDQNCTSNTGWTWTNSDRTTIEFCQAACDRIKDQKVKEFKLEIACSIDDVIVI